MHKTHTLLRNAEHTFVCKTQFFKREPLTSATVGYLQHFCCSNCIHSLKSILRRAFSEQNSPNRILWTEFSEQNSLNSILQGLVEHLACSRPLYPSQVIWRKNLSAGFSNMLIVRSRLRRSLHAARNVSWVINCEVWLADVKDCWWPLIIVKVAGINRITGSKIFINIIISSNNTINPGIVKYDWQT